MNEALYAFWAAGFVACIIFGLFGYSDTERLLMGSLRLSSRHAKALAVSITVFAAAVASTFITGIAWLIYQAQS